MPGKKTTPHLPRNFELARGVMRFSKARMYSKRGVWAKKPFKISIAQAYVMATKTRLDIASVSLPTHLDDAYFRRTSAKKQPKKENEADLFATGKSEYVISDQRKNDQKTVDKAILGVIRKHADKHTLFGYLGSRFSIGKNQYPHKMIF
uniref:Ribosomal protein L6 N-terminal domain-containing protein n=1 Tax=Plectus sambesii TaxID=2011161 RepID=A0A914XSG7_9BILA